jgi:hypothetical protein
MRLNASLVNTILSMPAVGACDFCGILHLLGDSSIQSMNPDSCPGSAAIHRRHRKMLSNPSSGSTSAFVVLEVCRISAAFTFVEMFIHILWQLSGCGRYIFEIPCIRSGFGIGFPVSLLFR